MQSLFKSLQKHTLSGAPTLRRTFPTMMTQARIFSTRAPGSDTSLGDVGELFKVNYTIEFD